MNRNINLNWLRTFEATARYLSFTAASKELGLTQTAVSIQIKSLETKLGQKLFIRGPKSLDLTEIGKAYLPAVRESLRSLSVSTDGLFNSDQANTLVVRASVALIVWLAPKLHGFKAQYPEVGIKFVTSIWPDGLEMEEVDIDIVLAANSQTNTQLERLSTERLVAISGSLMAKDIHSEEDLLQCQSIQITGFEDHWDHYLSHFNLRQGISAVNLQVDTSVAAGELVACNLGCAVVLERFALGFIESGRDVVLSGQAVPLNQSHYFSTADAIKTSKSYTDVFKAWLRDIFRDA